MEFMDYAVGVVDDSFNNSIFKEKSQIEMTPVTLIIIGPVSSIL